LKHFSRRKRPRRSSRLCWTPTQSSKTISTLKGFGLQSLRGPLRGSRDTDQPTLGDGITRSHEQAVAAFRQNFACTGKGSFGLRSRFPESPYPNRADAYFVVALCDWVLSEFIRLTFNCSLVEAQGMVDNLVERKVPIIQDFNRFPKILRSDLAIPDQILALAYRSGANGVAIEDLQRWLKPAKPGPISVAVLRLDRKALLHRDGSRCFITLSGIRYVEKNISFVLAA
jgi:hypothetical protein